MRYAIALGFRLITPLLVLICLLTSCSSQAPSQHLDQSLLEKTQRFIDCPPSPNCVSSDSRSAEHQIDAWLLATPPEQAWAQVKVAVTQLPRTRTVQEAPYYLHAESHSRIFRFVDDLQIQLRPEQGVIAIYSASRIGYSDFGTNRKRLLAIRRYLLEKGVITLQAQQ